MREADKRPEVTLDELQRSTAQVGGICPQDNPHKSGLSGREA